MLEYLDRSRPETTLFETAKKIGQLVAKIFYVTEKTCNQIYAKNPGMLKLLRMWLPVSGKVTKEQVEDAYRSSKNPIKLTHCVHSCTNYIIYAIGNIVATGEGYVSHLLNCDGFLALEYLYPGVPLICRREIATVIYNMLAISDDPCIGSIMLNLHLVEVLQQMLNEIDDEIVVKAMKSIRVLCKMLPTSKPHDNYILATSCMLAQDLAARGCLNSI